jgi:hypothetical protein
MPIVTRIINGCSDMSRFHKGLTMVYDTQDYWVFGLCPLSDILKNSIEHKASESDPVSLALFSNVLGIPYDGQSKKKQ